MNKLPPATGTPEAKGAWVLASYVLSHGQSSRDAKRLATALLHRINASPLEFEPLHHPTMVRACLTEAADGIEAELERFHREAVEAREGRQTPAEHEDGRRRALQGHEARIAAELANGSG